MTIVSPQVHPAARAPPPRHLHRRRSARVRVRVRASGDDDDDDGTWRWLRHLYLFSLLAASFLTHKACFLSVADAPSDANTALDFKRELQRRGITSAQTEQLKAKQPAGDAQPDTSQPRRRVQPPRWASDTPESLAQSRALGAEGLEGLIPRATQLLRLAFGFWIPFWPFMAVFSALFTLTYILFGDFFLHSGDYFEPETVLNSAGGASEAGQQAKRARGPPAYVVPEALLAEPTFDRMVPFESPTAPQ